MIDDVRQPRLVKSAHFSLQFTFAGRGRIWLVFEEIEAQRTQEFVLRWSPDHGRSFRGRA
jgi:hypothetical protein